MDIGLAGLHGGGFLVADVVMGVLVGGFIVGFLLILYSIEGSVAGRGVAIGNGFALGMHVLSDGRMEYPIPG